MSLWLAGWDPLLPGGCALAFALGVLAGWISRARRGRRERDPQRGELEGALSEARACLEHCPDGVLLLQGDGRICGVNAEMPQRMLYRREELLRLRLGDLDPSMGQAAWERLVATLCAEGRVQQQTRHYRRDGRAVQVEVNWVRITEGAEPLVCGFARDVRERREEGQQRQKLLRELSHRVKNNLTTVLALAEQSVPEVGDAFRERVMALSHAHDLLSRSEWRCLCLPELVVRVVEESPQVELEGGACALVARTSTALALTLCELWSNARRHGALRTPGGRVRVRWGESEEGVELVWREEAEGTVGADPEVGFGLEVVGSLIEHELEGTVRVERAPTGWGVRVWLPERLRVPS